MKLSKSVYLVLVALLALTTFSGQAAAQSVNDGKTGPNIVNPFDHLEGVLPGEQCVASGGVNCPAPIPDAGGGSLISSFDVTGCQGGLIEDVNVGVDIVHTWIGDLDITVASPAGTPVLLYNQDCGSEDDMAAIWDDEGGPFPCPPTGYLNYIPVTPLTAIDGEDGGGPWTLTINDNAGADIGELLDWSVELTCAAPIGACCLMDGTCVDTDEDSCGAQGGAYQGDGTDCDTTACEPVPTVPQYGLAALAALLSLAALATLAIRRRRLNL